MRQLLVSELIAAVRGLLDESNSAGLSDSEDIIPALNRAQDNALNILARHYEPPMLAYTDLTPTTQEQPLPSGLFEHRIEKLEWLIPNQNQPQECQRISYRDIGPYSNATPIPSPAYFCIVGENLRFNQPPTGTYQVRVWHLKDPLPLVKEQGRIESVNIGAASFTLDTAGADLTTTGDDSYINIISPTGTRKATFKVLTISGDTIRIKQSTSGSRSQIFGLTVDTSITTPATGLVPAQDDYVSLVHGSCIPLLKKPLSNYIIQFAVCQLRTKLGEANQDEDKIRQELEQVVERSWAGRPQTLRVKRRSQHFDSNIRFQFITTN